MFVFGLIINLVYTEPDFKILISNLIVGFFLVLISIFTRGGIGMGDAIIFLILALFLDHNSNVYILFFSLLLATIPSIILIIVKHKKNYTLPFVPFITSAVLLYLIIISTE